MKRDFLVIRMQMYYYMRSWMHFLGRRRLEISESTFRIPTPAYEGASSIKLLEEVGKLIDEKLYVIGNIDATIIAQRPKMAPHIEQMRKNVAEALHIEVEQVNIKATTEEGLGFTGTGEGISSQAIASLDTIANYSYRVGPAEGGCAGCGGCMKAQDR